MIPILRIQILLTAMSTNFTQKWRSTVKTIYLVGQIWFGFFIIIKFKDYYLFIFIFYLLIDFTRN